MGEESAKDVDPSAPEQRDLGWGLLETEMGPSSALAHLYRGEIHRMNIWRERLDRTTNWAVIVMAAILTWVFASRDNPHYILLVGVAAIAVFLFVEAHRYRGYDIWRSRVRTLQANVFAYGLDPSGGVEDPDWRRDLAEDYRRPRLHISIEEALAHRLRRVYLPLLLVLLVAWIVRTTAFAARPWPASAAIGQLPGLAVTAAVALGYAVAVVIAYRPRTWRARGELRAKDLRETDE